MRIRTCNRLVVALAVLGVATTATAEGKRVKKGEAQWEPPARGQTFDMSGEFSGPLTGEIRLGDETYVLAPDVQIYEADTGSMAVGTTVEKRVIYVAGVMRGGARIVNVVIVRPAGELEPLQGDPSQYITVKDPSSPE